MGFGVWKTKYFVGVRVLRFMVGSSVFFFVNVCFCEDFRCFFSSVFSKVRRPFWWFFNWSVVIISHRVIGQKKRGGGESWGW